MLPEVIVLVDEESKRHQVHMNLGDIEIKPSPYMCAVSQFPRIQKVFRYETFKLNVDDTKLTNYVNAKDGIMIFCDYKKWNDKLTTILNNNKRKPVFILLQKNDGRDLKAFTDTIRNFYNTHKRKNLVIYGFDYNRYKLFDPKDLLHNMGMTIDVAKDQFTRMMMNVDRKEFDITSRTIDPKEMMNEFENCTMDMRLWDHFGRIKMVYLSLKVKGYNDTIDTNGWLCTNWRKYKTSIGHGDLWNYSLTRMWTEIIKMAIERYPDWTIAKIFDTFDFMQKGSLFKEFYRSETIFSFKARREWIEPDLKSLASVRNLIQ